jgi:hypothetical protein
MQLTEELITKIQEAFQKLDPDNEYEIEVDEMEVGDEKVMIGFPRDDAEISVEELIKYTSEFGSLQFGADRVTTNRITQMPVFSDGKPLDYIINEINFKVTTSDYIIRLVENPLLIGIAATKMGIYDKYALPCSSYIAIEIEYKNDSSKLDEKEELNVLKTFMFELSHIADSPIDFNIIHESGAFDDYDEPEKQNIHLTNLPAFSDGMDLYRKALNSTDQEICFLYFYKIIEYYSPIAAKITAYENLARKLETLKYKNPTNKDLSAIVSITDKFRVSLTDKELAQTLLASSIDIVELFPKLPEEIKKRLSKSLHFKQSDLSYSTNADILQSIVNNVGSILYSTRNSIVHAKSNYKSDSNECKPTDLQTLNEFLKNACYSIISWNSKLSDHLKIVE